MFILTFHLYIMRQIIFFLSLIIYALIVRAQNEKSFERNRISVGGELTSHYTWQVDISYHYMISPYVGIGTSIGMWKQFTVEGVPKGNGWIIADDYKNIKNIYLHPSLHIVSPTLMKISDGELKMFLEPGFMMNIPYCNVSIYLLNNYGIENDVRNTSTNKGKWYAFDCKIGFSLNLDNISISTGYQYSTLDVFSMRRELIYDNKRFDDFYPKKSNLHGGFFSISVYF